MDTLQEPLAKGCLPFCTDIGTGDLSGELRGCRGVVGLSLANSQKGWSVNLTAEHGRYARRAQPLREREEVVIQVPATVRQCQLAAKPDGELDRQQAVYCSDHRRRHGLGVVREVAKPDLARASGNVPASQPGLHAEALTARRAAVQRRHAFDPR